MRPRRSSRPGLLAQRGSVRELGTAPSRRALLAALEHAHYRLQHVRLLAAERLELTRVEPRAVAVKALVDGEPLVLNGLEIEPALRTLHEVQLLDPLALRRCGRPRLLDGQLVPPERVLFGEVLFFLL